MNKVVMVGVVLAMPIFLWLRGSPPEELVLESQVLSHDQQMLEIQGKLKQDPNQADLWFQLGHGYINEQDFTSALTCFDYALRLSEQPTASQLSAKAMVLYYLNKQQMLPAVTELLDQALALDENNLTALSLIASDHFVSSRYQQAIEVWTRMLDSQHQDLDRVSVIHSLNQAKQLRLNRT
ncbi:TPR domain-containing protein [Vibrio japonicus]|uniref:Nitrite reductase n=1 Tax=Vibrio japonicus TaxID=1824638 RepID=A0ABY5LCY3_9VIBR|nr:nitrite reductase [Vibrio japonicus]UUM29864.1 nitrite reductase [Vibrio japonicus]